MQRNKTFKSVVFFICVVMLFGVGTALAKKPKAMTAVDLLNIPFVYRPHLSPDGKRVTYIRYDADWEKNKQIANIWLTELASGHSRQLTFDHYTQSQIEWSPDGRFISFLAKRNGDDYKQLYLLPTGGGEAFVAARHDADIKKYYWGKDSQSIYFLANEPLPDSVVKRIDSKDDMFAFEQSLTYRHIWQLDIKEKTIKKITDGNYFVVDFDLSDDNTIIAFNRAQEVRIDDRHSADIWVVPTTGGKAKRVTNNQFEENAIQISPDNKHILFISDVNEKGEQYYDANVFVVSIEQGDLTPLAIEHSFEVENARWSNDGATIYIKANMGVRSELWALGVDDKRALQLTDGEHTIRDWTYSAQTDKHAVVITTASNPGDIWLLPGKGGELTSVTTINEQLAKQFKLPQQKLVRWQAADGTELEGLLSLPWNYKKRKRYPLLTHAHGGPRSSDQYGQFRWRTYIPVLTAMGYAYFTPNYRGGRGYGDAFLRDMVGGYFNNAHLDVLSGIDHLIEQRIADPDKLIAAGWSAGGHMTNKLITVTDRFRAASSGAGAVDWVSMYGESDTRFDRTFWFGGTPWQQHAPLDVYRQHSPLKDMWKVTTPTLIFVGEKDIRVPPTQSILLYRALKDLGVKTKLYIAPRERHGFTELRHRLYKINAELEWFERHVHGRDYQWQKAPE